jgi:Protein of unknown function (DUF3486)
VQRKEQGELIMGVRSKVAMLPEEVRRELDRRIIQHGFSGYQELADWLQNQGFQIAEDSVQRYGDKLRQEIEARERAVYLAQALAERVPEGDEAIVEGTISIINQRVFTALVDAEQLELKDLPRFVRMAAELSRTNIARQKRAEEVSDRLEARQQAAAKAAKPKGLSREAYYMIRCALLDIDPFSPEGRAMAAELGAVVPPAVPSSPITADSPGDERREKNEEIPPAAAAPPDTLPERTIGSEVSRNDGALETPAMAPRTSPQLAAPTQDAGTPCAPRLPSPPPPPNEPAPSRNQAAQAPPHQWPSILDDDELLSLRIKRNRMRFAF